jgi:5'(3')-deoxyribonucleotidase
MPIMTHTEALKDALDWIYESFPRKHDRPEAFEDWMKALKAGVACTDTCCQMLVQKLKDAGYEIPADDDLYEILKSCTILPAVKALEMVQVVIGLASGVVDYVVVTPDKEAAREALNMTDAELGIERDEYGCYEHARNDATWREVEVMNRTQIRLGDWKR